MNHTDLSPTELAQRVNDLKKIGFTVHVETSKNGIVYKVTKKEPKVEFSGYY